MSMGAPIRTRAVSVLAVTAALVACGLAHAAAARAETPNGLDECVVFQDPLACGPDWDPWAPGQGGGGGGGGAAAGSGGAGSGGGGGAPDPTSPMPGSDAPWVADRFDYMGTTGWGADVYRLKSGGPISGPTAWALGKNYNYSKGCHLEDGLDTIAFCSD